MLVPYVLCDILHLQSKSLNLLKLNTHIYFQYKGRQLLFYVIGIIITARRPPWPLNLPLTLFQIVSNQLRRGHYNQGCP